MSMTFALFFSRIRRCRVLKAQSWRGSGHWDGARGFHADPTPQTACSVLGTAPGVFVRMPTPNRIDCSIGPSRTSSRSGHPRQIEMSSLTSCSGRPREGKPSHHTSCPSAEVSSLKSCSRLSGTQAPHRSRSRSGPPRLIEKSSLTSCSGRPREGQHRLLLLILHVRQRRWAV